MTNFKAITEKSKNKNDLQQVQPSKTFNDICKKKTHTEFLCELHMKDRLLNFCHRDSLTDVVFSGITSIKFSKLEFESQPCKNKSCPFNAEYRIDRID